MNLRPFQRITRPRFSRDFPEPAPIDADFEAIEGLKAQQIGRERASLGTRLRDKHGANPTPDNDERYAAWNAAYARVTSKNDRTAAVLRGSRTANSAWLRQRNRPASLLTAWLERRMELDADGKLRVVRVDRAKAAA